MNTEQINALAKLGITASLVVSSYSIVKKKKKSSKDLVNLGVATIVGTQLIHSL